MEDSGLLLEIVRLTARTSALICAASLVAGAAELVEPGSTFARRGAGWKLLAGLLISHTIHFAMVLALAVATDGANVSGRGGWVLASMVGVAFYAATGGALLLRRVPSAARTLTAIAGDAALSLLVGLAFFVTYLGGFSRSPIYAVMSLLIGGAMIAFVTAAAVRLARLLARPGDRLNEIP